MKYRVLLEVEVETAKGVERGMDDYTFTTTWLKNTINNFQDYLNSFFTVQMKSAKNNYKILEIEELDYKKVDLTEI